MKPEPTRVGKPVVPPSSAAPTPPSTEPPRRRKALVLGVTLSLVAAAAIYVLSGFRCVVPVGSRGVEVRSGAISREPLAPGTYLCLPGPFSRQVVPFSIRWSTVTISASCLTDKLKPVTLTLRVSYRLPEEKLVEIYEEYGGDPFAGVVAPQIQAAVKQEVQQHSAKDLATLARRPAIESAIKKASLPSTRKAPASEAASPLLELRVDDIELPAIFVSAVATEAFIEDTEKSRTERQEEQQFQEKMALARTKAEAERLRTRLSVLTSDPVIQRMLEKWDGRTRLDLLSLLKDEAEPLEKKNP